MTDPAPPHDGGPMLRLPRQTTPTWEVELLISGVAVFAMLQLPGWLDDRLYALVPRFEDEIAQPLRMVYVYLKSAALILAATFCLHLLLRAQWIALVGMHSVFPGGIRWERLRMGPVQREIETARYAGPLATIERADNRATVLFSIGVMLASTLLLITAFVSALFLLAIGARAATGMRADIGTVLGYCTIVALLPLFAAMLLDRHRGERLRRDGRVRRVLAAVLRFYSRVGIMQRASNPAFSLLSSHGGERRATAATIGVFLLASAAVLLSIHAGRSARNLGSYALFPAFADGARTLDEAHYDDERDPSRHAAVPFIGSAVATQAYVRLVVPYRPNDDAAALRAGCPAAASANGDARAAALLDCLQRAHAVALDGRPLASLRYEAGSDVRTDRPALVAMIDVRGLAPGRHELQVARAAAAGGEAPRPWRIPFWR